MPWSIWLLVVLPFADSASLAGVVTQRGVGTPVPSALVAVVGGRARTQTDGSGRFRLTGLASGTHVVRIQRVGFAPLEFEIDLAPGEAVMLRPGELLLDAAAVTMDSVVVTATGERFIPSLVAQGFYDRRKMSPGAFLSRAEFTKWHSASFTDALRRMPGVSIVANPNYHRAARPPRLGAMGIIPGRTKMGMDTRRNLIKVRGCETIGVWLDGVSMGTSEEIDVDALISLTEIEAIEVFRGPSEMPARFAASRAVCGAMVIWTRVGGAAR